MKKNWIKQSLFVLATLSIGPLCAMHTRVASECISVIDAHTESVRSVAFNPQGTLLAVGTHSGTVLVWRVADGQVQMNTLIKLELPEWASSVTFNQQGTVLVSSSTDGKIRTWRIGDGWVQPKASEFFAGEGVCGPVAFNHRGTLLVAGSNSGKLYVWPVENGCVQAKKTKKVDGDGILSTYSVAFNSQALLLAAAGWGAKAIHLWRVGDDKVQKNNSLDLPHLGWCQSLAFNSQGTLLAAGFSDGVVRVLPLVAGCVRIDNQVGLLGHTGEILAVAFNSQGTLLATGSADKTIRVWRIIDGKVQADKPAVLTGHTDTIMSLAFKLQEAQNIQEEMLVSGSGDGTVRVWRLSQSTETARQSETASSSTEQARGDTQEPQECFICLQEASQELGPLNVIPCDNNKIKHDGLVHTQCWDQWVHDNHTCPVCRGEAKLYGEYKVR
ncbi:hypothetical protein CVU75_00180 [Candidatus Dependentiae bacterium HGW-Dependentiae-1]|nr:MAG: hypothetical protein CVU75_00180 [Candidatus Dependentiae bacterium HGW-Dependentiae-1]